MTAPTFAQPEYASSGYNLPDHVGHLLAYLPIEYQTGIMTKFQKPGEAPKDAVKATVVCVDCEEEYNDVLAFQGFIIGVTKTRIGEIVLGRLKQEPSNTGGFPSWQLGTFTEADGRRAVDYWNRRSINSFAQPVGSTQTSTAQPVPADQTRDMAALKAQVGAELR